MSTTSMGLRATVGLLVLATVASGCGPYATVGQKLDAGFQIAGGEAWITVAGTEVKILVVGKSPDGTQSTFSFSSLSVPVASGLTAMHHAPPLAAQTFQGTWQESSGTMSLKKQIEYKLPNEGSVDLMRRLGAARRDGLNDLLVLGAVRSDGHLTLSGDPLFAGSYIPMGQALGHLATASADDAACAFHVANLTVMTAQARILYFGSALMLQYRTPSTFEGTVSGDVRVAMSGGLTAPDVDIQFNGLSDFPGATLADGQRTHTDSGGNGTTTGTVTFLFQPDAADASRNVSGAIEYDLQIKDGYAAGGHYTITLDGGATGTVDPTAPPSPTIAACLGLE